MSQNTKASVRVQLFVNDLNSYLLKNKSKVASRYRYVVVISPRGKSLGAAKATDSCSWWHKLRGVRGNEWRDLDNELVIGRHERTRDDCMRLAKSRKLHHWTINGQVALLPRETREISCSSL